MKKKDFSIINNLVSLQIKIIFFVFELEDYFTLLYYSNIVFSEIAQYFRLLVFAC